MTVREKSISCWIGFFGCMLALGVACARAEVTLPDVFSAHMVLQRECAVPVWGAAAPGEKVTVTFRNQEKTATADAAGKWMVKLDPLTAGGPDNLTVTALKTVVIEDVLVGEVWVGSGQSNMEYLTGYFAAGDPVLARMMGERYPQIRLTTATRAWQEATPESIKSFSALLFAFGVALQKHLNVPVGLMLGAAGGSPSGYWLTRDMLAADPASQAAAAEAEARAPFALRQQKYEQDLARYNAAQQGDKKAISAPPSPPIRAGEAYGKVGHLYETFIKPLQPYAIRGVLWDQGESNTALEGIDQYTTMGALIRGWRRAWGEGEFPFLYVQKPGGGGCAWDPASPVTKEAAPFTPLPASVPDDGDAVGMFIKIMTYPKTAMVTSSDLGAGLHPVNKSGYGQRAADVALGFVYGGTNDYYGPVYKSHQAEGATIRVSFSHVGQGLAFKHGDQLQGFAMAGKDKAWHWAEAWIDSNTVVLSSQEVPEPVAVQYAWTVNRPWANLFNKGGLPALPFCTAR